MLFSKKKFLTSRDKYQMYLYDKRIKTVYTDLL